ncbi:conserved hypothetical protein [Ricinus communis]|uniref:Uncharacterized protein n=1 Tax=Ricinus communis TaxID=3988 RepID=B9TBJ3_RICCO|nr:conserved hypothetical protein [Ricinus communis]
MGHGARTKRAKRGIIKEAPAGRDRSGAGLYKSSPVLKRQAHVTRVKKTEQSKKTPDAGCGDRGKLSRARREPPRTNVTLAARTARINGPRGNTPFQRAQTGAARISRHPALTSHAVSADAHALRNPRTPRATRGSCRQCASRTAWRSQRAGD